MKEKLIEEWLIRAKERGGIDQAYGQWLISRGHEILWLGHSPTEFGKDIVSIDPNGDVHVFQIKDENLTLPEFRKIRPQIIELTETPPLHPRIPRGTKFTPHLITSGLARDDVSLQIDNLNGGLEGRGLQPLDLVDRRSLIPRFVDMADGFWPELPADVRDFMLLYFANGRGDFDSERFSKILKALLLQSDGQSTPRTIQSLAGACILGHCLLSSFERESDHWSVFQGLIMICGHIAWCAERRNIPNKSWVSSYELCKAAALESLVRLANESLDENSLASSDWELDVYTGSRNLIAVAAVSVISLLGLEDKLDDRSKIENLVSDFLNKRLLFCWGEGSIPFLFAIQKLCESKRYECSVLPLIETVIEAMIERNHPYSNDEPFAPPHVSADTVLTNLCSYKNSGDKPKRGTLNWTLEALIHYLARRGCRHFLEKNWKEISKLSMSHFEPENPNDLLIWRNDLGREVQTLPSKKQSWSDLVEQAQIDCTANLPPLLQKDPVMLLLYGLVLPHRFTNAAMSTLDRISIFC